MKRRHLLPIGAVVAVAVGVGYWAHLRRLREPLQSFSARAFAAIDARDGAALARMMSPAEREATGLDGARLSRLLNWFHSATQGYRPGDRAFRSDKERDSLASVERYYRAANGDETILSLYCVRDENGPHVFVSYALVTCGLAARYKPRFSREPDRTADWLALRAGIEAERPFFASLPLRGVTGTDGSASFYTWTALGTFAEQAVARHRLQYEALRSAKTP